MDTKKMFYDVLVIGGGEAGIRAAIQAKLDGAEKVLLATKGKFGSAGVMFSEITFGWDMQASTGENDPTDSKAVHLADIMNAAQGTCSEKMAKILTEESPARVHDLENLFGLEVYKKPDGTPRQVYGCFSTKNRAYQFTHPDQIKKKVAGGIEKYGVEMIDGLMITDLIVRNGVCYGAVGIKLDNTRYKILSKATIVACGGATGMYKHNFASPGMCGDGYALVLNAGCSLANMEFMQFGLGILEPKYRALFLDRLMYLQPKVEFTYDHHFPCSMEEMLTVHSKHFPFSTIDKSALFDVAVFEETVRNNGKGVAVDLSVIPIEKLEEIPVWDLYFNYFDADKNPYDNKIYITEFAHACNGGVIVNENAETEIKGLYAAGEMITGPHGANRLGGNMHAACQVFGTRAGANAAAYAKKNENAIDIDTELPKERCSLAIDDYISAKRRIADTLWENVNVVRNESGLKAAQSVIDEAKCLIEKGVPEDKCLWQYYELKSTVLAASAIVAAALERTETRGSHNRNDYPTMDEKPYVVKCKLQNEKMITSRCDHYPIK